MTNEEFKKTYHNALRHGWVSSDDEAIRQKQKEREREYNRQYYEKHKNDNKYRTSLSDVTDAKGRVKMDSAANIASSKNAQLHRDAKKFAEKHMEHPVASAIGDKISDAVDKVIEKLSNIELPQDHSGEYVRNITEKNRQEREQFERSFRRLTN